MNILRSISLIAISAFLSGCISAYKLPADSKESAFVKLEKKGGKIPFGGVILMLKVDDDFVCRLNKGVTDQQKLAVLSRGSAAGQFNEDGLNVEVDSNFRFMVRSVGVNSVEAGSWYADTDMCDVLFSMPTEPNRSYKVLTSFDENGCAVEVVDPARNNAPIELTEYKKC